MSKIAVITSPFLTTDHHFLMLQQTLFSLGANKTKHDLDLIAFANKIEGDASIHKAVAELFDVFEYNDQNNLSRSWNKGINLGFQRGADYCLVINLDLSFNSNFIDALVDFASSNREIIIWSGSECSDFSELQNISVCQPRRSVHFSCFLIDKRLFELVGEFDENFAPAYYEDSDMLYRILLKNLKVEATPYAIFYHFERSTINGLQAVNDKPRIEKIVSHLDRNGQYYQEKWGGMPGQEKYTVPFGP